MTANHEKTIYFTILIDLVESRLRFENQRTSSQLMTNLTRRLNVRFADELGGQRFHQKDGDAIMLVLPAGNETQIFSIYQYCYSLYYQADFEAYYTEALRSNQVFECYFSVGMGTIDTSSEVNDNVDIVNGSSVIQATMGLAEYKQRVRGAGVSTPFVFERSPFKFSMQSVENNEMQPNIAAVTGLFYLLFEKILNTTSKKFSYTLLYPRRELSNIELAQELAEAHGIETYDVNYQDPRQRAQASSKISVMLAPIRREPVESIQQAIVQSLINARKELENEL